MEYTGLDFYGALALPCDLFLQCCRNRVQERLQATAEGRAQLADRQRLGRQTIDRQGLDALCAQLACGHEQEA